MAACGGASRSSREDAAPSRPRHLNWRTFHIHCPNRLAALFAAAFVLLAAGCATTSSDRSTSNFPIGAYEHGDNVATFNADGTFSGSSRTGEAWVRGTFTHTPTEFTMVDTWEGPTLIASGNACLGRAGTYRWTLSGDVLVANVVEDACAGRRQGIDGVAWTRMR